MFHHKKYFFILFFIAFNFHSKAQSTVSKNGLYHDIGVMTGGIVFQSDYLQKNPFGFQTGANGYSFGVLYYLDSNTNYNKISQYLKWRGELTYIAADLQHTGKYVDISLQSTTAKQLRAMRGTVSGINLGTQVEYYPFKNDDYNYATFAPYVSLGAMISVQKTKAWSILGNINDVNVTPTKYINAFRNESVILFSATTSIGTRIKINNKNSLFTEAKFQYYFSDWADGLNPNSAIYKENKSNDMLTYINIGYIYSFDN
ncbi:hypothetical protein FLBR109950_00540 [Flavobacterium branchiophilum]|uniref:Glutamate dehydrogenase n=2 Tax=Flavobacterium branchiophilum TaxID=55197 RepID=G2Z521_FLABF|nr:hypothetical protein [Flavobacterium branchiophilum]CCB70747.1 Protein of unknown function precursor [Flavobacterium branchiophilum FL-15]